MSDMMLMVMPAIQSAPTTPTADSGSDTRMASGSIHELNCNTSTKYIPTTATASASRMLPNTSCWSSTSPAYATVTPAGSEMAASCWSMPAATSPRGRPSTFAVTVTEADPLSCSMRVGAVVAVALATCAKGTACSAPSAPGTCSGSAARSPDSRRSASGSRTRTLRRSPSSSIHRPASTPANAACMAPATSAGVVPSVAEKVRSSRMSSAGAPGRLESVTSTAPGTVRMRAAMAAATCGRVEASAPRTCS